jgi:CRISPR system Cascade subunit CasE
MRSNEVLGYVKATPEALLDCSINRAHDALVAKATGMGHLRAKQLPTVWRQGRQLSFEARARPVVRSRRNPRSGALDEVDVALHRAAQDPSVTRERAYLDWIAGQLMRDGAAQLLSATLHAFCRTRVARQSNTTNGRRIVQSEGPDVWIRGTLQIERPDAFDSLLRRGVGRHRAFGFGCMLVAPAGVFA